ncbi:MULTISPECIES: hypothetical protein [Halorubrum]|uniref:hypothetical protein n=1 Tax=Halorubrum TaxID=56688 RepID=UPI0006781878|nr:MULTISPECIES: hypothetical protein [Halorubrum]TKX68338.1 hypothetical protein EXE40_12820 [Halorubrum sp. GN11GM_10-3_MGM]
MNRREIIGLGGLGALGGGGAIVGTTLYGSSKLDLERDGDSTVVRKDGEQIDSLEHVVTTVEYDGAILGISTPHRSNVQKTEVAVVWAIRRDGLWADVTVELVTSGDVRTSLSRGTATVYGSTWRSPWETEGSSRSKRRYAYRTGTTAGRLGLLHTVFETTESENEVIELEARLSARSLTGSRVELTTQTELISTLN